MIKDLLDGISVKLNNLFGDEYEISIENQKQGFNSPCFFIKPIEPNNTNKLGSRALRDYPFDIIYFPKEETNAEMLKVAEELYIGLEYVELLDGSLLRSKNMRFEIVDDVLHFFLDFNFYINKPVEPQQAMEILTVEQKG